jgi:hypothetical protein
VRSSLTALALLLVACGPGAEPPAAEAPPPAEEGPTPEEREAARVAAAFPLTAVVTGVQLRVRAEPSPDADILGWVRLGARLHLRDEPTPSPRCATGWYPLHPAGWVCAGEGLDLTGTATEEGESLAADVDSALPYRYLLARQPQVPEYHRLPTRSEQRQAAEHAARYLELLERGQEARAERFRGGRGLPRSPAVVARYLHRGFHVAGVAVESRAGRRFVRTVRGSYVQEAQLIERTGVDFRGVELGGEDRLPVAWAVRGARPRLRRERSDGSVRYVRDIEASPLERQERLDWLGRVNEGDRVYHRIRRPEGERFLRAWYAAVAEPIERPRGVAADEVWVHVDLGQQTLVLYEGDTARYATLVSSGQEGHETPTGLYPIQRKLVSDTMANVGDTFDDAYRIEDVPYTQYFERSFALHGAFWHGQFGLRRSHGCVNLSPPDARYVFERTAPSLDPGWHGLRPEALGRAASHVYITE